MATKKTTKKTTTRSVTPTLDDVKLSQIKKTSTDEASTRIKSARIAELKNKFQEINDEKFATSLAKASVELNKLLSSVGDTQRASLEELQELSELIEIKVEELEELRGKEVVAASLNELLAKYNTKEEEYQLMISDNHQKWTVEATNHQQAVIDRNNEIKKTREHEQSDYDYNLMIARRNDNDQWELTKQSRKKDLLDEETALNDSWIAREKSIREMEIRAQANDDKLNNLDATIKSEVDAAVAKATSALSSTLKATHKMELVDAQHQLDIANRNAITLSDKISERDSDVARLRQENADMSDKLARMASSALEASSGRFALDQLQKSADKNIPNGKR